MRMVMGHSDWAEGFEDETWWSRLAQPNLHTWVEEGHPLKLVQKALSQDDPDPKALACYGLLVRWYSQGQPEESIWLRFADGNPNSGLTIQYLTWCCAKLHANTKRVLALIWDNASWHISEAVHGMNRTCLFPKMSLETALAKTAKQADSLSMVLGFVLAGIVGAVAINPGMMFFRAQGFMGILARLTPHAHAVERYYSLIAEKAGLVDILPQAGILLAMSALFVLIARWRFKFIV
jgi:hypothetical protein